MEVSAEWMAFKEEASCVQRLRPLEELIENCIGKSKQDENILITKVKRKRKVEKQILGKANKGVR